MVETLAKVCTYYGRGRKFSGFFPFLSYNIDSKIEIVLRCTRFKVLIDYIEGIENGQMESTFCPSTLWDEKVNSTSFFV